MNNVTLDVSVALKALDNARVRERQAGQRVSSWTRMNGFLQTSAVLGVLLMLGEGWRSLWLAGIFFVTGYAAGVIMLALAKSKTRIAQARLEDLRNTQRRV